MASRFLSCNLEDAFIAPSRTAHRHHHPAQSKNDLHPPADYRLAISVGQINVGAMQFSLITFSTESLPRINWIEILQIASGRYQLYPGKWELNCKILICWHKTASVLRVDSRVHPYSVQRWDANRVGNDRRGKSCTFL